MYIGLAAWSQFFVKCFYWSGSIDHQNGGNEREEKEAVLAMEKKSKPKNSVWKRLKSPFRKKKDSVT